MDLIIWIFIILLGLVSNGCSFIFGFVVGNVNAAVTKEAIKRKEATDE